jgi:hypothetical protein
VRYLSRQMQRAEIRDGVKLFHRLRDHEVQEKLDL